MYADVESMFWSWLAGFGVRSCLKVWKESQLTGEAQEVQGRAGHRLCLDQKSETVLISLL